MLHLKWAYITPAKGCLPAGPFPLCLSPMDFPFPSINQAPAFISFNLNCWRFCSRLRYFYCHLKFLSLLLLIWNISFCFPDYFCLRLWHLQQIIMLWECIDFINGAITAPSKNVDDDTPFKPTFKTTFSFVYSCKIFQEKIWDGLKHKRPKPINTAYKTKVKQ